MQPDHGSVWRYRYRELPRIPLPRTRVNKPSADAADLVRRHHEFIVDSSPFVTIKGRKVMHRK